MRRQKRWRKESLPLQAAMRPRAMLRHVMHHHAMHPHATLLHAMRLRSEVYNL